MSARDVQGFLELRNAQNSGAWAQRYYSTGARPLADLRNDAQLRSYRLIQFARMRKRRDQAIAERMARLWARCMIACDPNIPAFLRRQAD